MPRNKLAKLLLEDQSTESSTGQHVNTYNIDQIISIQAELSQRLHTWDPTVNDYNPLFEIAKLALTTDNEDLRFKCHSRLADQIGGAHTAAAALADLPGAMRLSHRIV